jgi:hypothetical protein
MMFVAIDLSESSAARGHKKYFRKNDLLVMVVRTVVTPWEALPKI